MGDRVKQSQLKLLSKSQNRALFSDCASAAPEFKSWGEEESAHYARTIRNKARIDKSSLVALFGCCVTPGIMGTQWRHKAKGVFYSSLL